MLKRIRIIFMLAVLATCTGVMAQDAVLPVVDQAVVPGAVFEPARTFNGESLYGYIDGGADLYLEYGFETVRVTSFILGTAKYKIDIYRMSDPGSAFGIFSVSRFRCLSRPAFTTFTCQNKYQLQICKGPFYISIVNDRGTAADSTLSITIGEKIAGQVKDTDADISGFFPDSPEAEVRNLAILVKGRLGLMNGAPDLEDFFRDTGGFTAAILKQQDGILVSVRFENTAGISEFAALKGWVLESIGDKFLQTAGGDLVRKINETHLLLEIPQ